MSGEKQDGRQVIDRTVERLVKAGIPVEHAKKKAREARIRNEERESGDRK